MYFRVFDSILTYIFSTSLKANAIINLGDASFKKKGV